MYKIKNKNTVEYRCRSIASENYFLKEKLYPQNILSSIYFVIFEFYNNTERQFYALHFLGIFEHFIQDNIIKNNYNITDKIKDNFIGILSDLITNDNIMECQNDIRKINEMIQDNESWIHSQYHISNKVINLTNIKLKQFVSEQIVPEQFYSKHVNFEQNKEKYQALLDNTFNKVKQYIDKLPLDNKLKRIYDDEKHFKVAKDIANDKIDAFKNSIEHTLFPTTKDISPLTKEHYLSFLLDDVIVDNDFNKFKNALIIAFKNDLYITYLSSSELEVRKYKPQITHKQTCLNKLELLLRDNEINDKTYYKLYQHFLLKFEANFSLLASIILTLELGLSESNGIKIGESMSKVDAELKEKDTPVKNSINKKTFKKHLIFLGNLIYAKDLIDKNFVNISTEHAKHIGKIEYPQDIVNSYNHSYQYREIFSALDESSTKEIQPYKLTKYDLRIFDSYVSKYLVFNSYSLYNITFIQNIKSL